MKWLALSLRALAAVWLVLFIGAGAASVLATMITRVGNPATDILGRELRPASLTERWLAQDNRGLGHELVLADWRWRLFNWTSWFVGIGGGFVLFSAAQLIHGAKSPEELDDAAVSQWLWDHDLRPNAPALERDQVNAPSLFQEMEDDGPVFGTSLRGDQTRPFAAANHLVGAALRAEIARVAKSRGDDDLASLAEFGGLSDKQLREEVWRRYGA